MMTMPRLALMVIASTLLAGCGSPPSGPSSTGIQTPRPEGAMPRDGDVIAKPGERKVIQASVQPEPIQAEPLKFDEIIKSGDRIAFVGDDVTQQQFYVRSLGTALLCMKPGYGLRLFNGGIDGATATTALDWADDFLVTSKPTVVFLCFGLNDGKNLPPSDAVVDKYEDSLGKLIEKVKATQGVREVVVMSAPAVQTGQVEQGNKGGYNQTLYRLAMSAQTIATVKKVKFVDLYDPMRVVYTEAARAGGDMLTIGGRLPTEDAHTVLASVILYGIGVTRPMLEPVGWAPLKAPRMGRIRGALGITLSEPDYRLAVQSRTVYEKMREFDALFFQAWRLAKPDRKTRSRPELLEQADASWFELDTYVRGAYASAR